MKNFGWILAAVFGALLVYQLASSQSRRELSAASMEGPDDIAAEADRAALDQAHRQLETYREELQALGEENAELKDQLFSLEADSGTERRSKESETDFAPGESDDFPLEDEDLDLADDSTEPAPGGVQLVDSKFRVMKRQGNYWYFSYAITLKNENKQPASVMSKIFFLDAEGLPIETAYTDRRLLKARETWTFRGQEMIRASEAARVVSYRAERIE